MVASALVGDAVWAFSVFADRLNFTHAAEQLHVSQPALHAKIGKLAKDLGVALYVKEGRQLRLTSEGEALARYARDVARRAHEVDGELRGQVNPTLRIAAGEGTLLYVLGPALRDAQNTTGLRLQLKTRSRDETVADVRAARADLGVTVLGEIPDDLACTPVATFPMLVAVPTAHPLAAVHQVTPRDLEGAALIVPPEGRPYREVTARLLAEHQVSWTVAVEAHGWPVSLKLVGLGIGLAIVNGCVQAPEGVALRPLAAMHPVTYHAVMRPEAIEDPRVNLFVQLIRGGMPSRDARFVPDNSSASTDGD